MDTCYITHGNTLFTFWNFSTVSGSFLYRIFFLVVAGPTSRTASVNQRDPGGHFWGAGNEVIDGGGGRMQRERRGKNVVHQLIVTLENVYNGAAKKTSLAKECDL